MLPTPYASHTTSLPPHPQDSLVRVSLALSAVLAYRLYRLWDEQPPPGSGTTGGLLPADGGGGSGSGGFGFAAMFLLQHLVEVTGVALGLLVAHYIRAAAPGVLAPRSGEAATALPQQTAGGRSSSAASAWFPPDYPWSFNACLALTLLELLAFARVAAQPSYEFHIDATLPVGAIYFVFVWRSDVAMRRSLDDAKMGLEASQRLVRTVGSGGGGGLGRAKDE